MILWLTGNTGAGKSTLARKLAARGTIILDGDEIRNVFQDTDLSREGRERHNLRVARLAKVLAAQGHSIIVAVICPYRDLRAKVKTICDCRFIYVPGGKEGPEYPYEVPGEDEAVYFKNWNKDPRTKRVVEAFKAIPKESIL